MQKLEILYEDEDLIVCYKPAGIATQTKRLGQPDMESLLKNHIALARRREARDGVPFIGVIHRLDQPVEGVMVFAKTPKAASALSAQVQKRSFGKKYYALVELPSRSDTFARATGLPDQGALSDTILFSPRENLSTIVPDGTKGGKKALLAYRVLAQQEGRALLDITLHTGRHHQIRAQLAHLHTPICGDTKYGSGGQRIDSRGTSGHSRTQPGALCLCSYYLQFAHPKDGHEMIYTIEPHNEKLLLFTRAVKS